jgi:hypothetical protein
MFGLLVHWFVISSPISTSAESPATGCQKATDLFIATPNQESLTALSRLDNGSCWPLIGSSNAKLGLLNRSVEKGNQFAAQYLAEYLSQLGGGNLEDALRALGLFADHHMERLLFFAKKGLLSKNELEEDALTMLPLSLSDDPRAQLGLLCKRKNSVLRVTRTSLSEQRSQALSAISAFMSEIRTKNPALIGTDCKFIP